MEGDDGLYLRHAGFKRPADRIGLEFLREERMQRFGNHFLQVSAETPRVLEIEQGENAA